VSGGNSGGFLKNSGSSANAGSGSTVTNPGQGTLSMDSNGRIIRTMANGRQFYVDPGQEKYQSILSEYNASRQQPSDTALPLPKYQEPDTSALEAQVQSLLSQLAGSQYTPIDQSHYTKDVISYEEALAMADQFLAPKYEQSAQQTAAASAQNLERSGLWDSFYGQDLMASQANQLNSSRRQAVNDMALQLVNQERSYAMQLLDAAVNENQFGHNYNQSGLSSAANLAINTINSLVQQAANMNDHNLQRASIILQEQAQKVDAQYKAGLITQLEAETALVKLQTQGQDLENQLAQKQFLAVRGGGDSGGSGSGGGYSGGYSSGSGSSGGGALPSIKDSLNNQATYSSSGGDIFYQVARNVRNMRDKGAADSVIGNYLADRIEDNSISSEQAQKILVSYGNILMQ
ncbi:MAG: hypothetical protein RR387_05275, partial [Clostridiales bacterium]